MEVGRGARGDVGEGGMYFGLDQRDSKEWMT